MIQNNFGKLLLLSVSGFEFSLVCCSGKLGRQEQGRHEHRADRASVSTMVGMSTGRANIAKQANLYSEQRSKQAATNSNKQATSKPSMASNNQTSKQAIKHSSAPAAQGSNTSKQGME